MVNLSKFSERLRECVAEEGSAAKLAKELHVARSTIFELMRGSFLPSTRVLILLIEHFGCSADYLLGLIELPKSCEFKELPPFSDRLREVLQLFSVTQYRLEKDTGFSGAIVYGWLSGHSVPSVDSLVRLAEYLGCSVDFLLGRER